MMKNIVPISIAVATSLILIFAVLSYLKPRGDRSEFIIGLLNNLGEKRRSIWRRRRRK